MNELVSLSEGRAVCSNICTYGSVRGMLGNRYSYRDSSGKKIPASRNFFLKDRPFLWALAHRCAKLTARFLQGNQVHLFQFISTGFFSYFFGLVILPFIRNEKLAKIDYFCEKITCHNILLKNRIWGLRIGILPPRYVLQALLSTCYLTLHK